jgi:predicted esterase
VLVAGIYDLAADVRASPLLSLGLRRAFGCGPQGCPPSELLLPATWVDPSDPPVTLVHGTGDRVAPTDGSVRFADALRAAGVPVSLEIVPGGHRGTEVDAAVRQALADARDQRGRASSSR